MRVEEIKGGYRVTEGDRVYHVWLDEDAEMVFDALYTSLKCGMMTGEIYSKYREAVDLLKSFEHGVSDFDMFVLKKFLKENKL